jgi:ABC-2 type transport system permease protein
MSVLSPAIALQQFSSALAGTDISAHHHFILAAERQRNLIIREMNEDMMLNGAGQGDRYVASAALWDRVPQFAYEPPSASFAIRSLGWDLAVLVLWGAAAAWFAWRSARRQSPL